MLALPTIHPAIAYVLGLLTGLVILWMACGGEGDEL